MFLVHTDLYKKPKKTKTNCLKTRKQIKKRKKILKIKNKKINIP